MKKYIIEFTYLDGTKEEVEFNTDNLVWTVDQYCRNRKIVNHQVLNENNAKQKKKLFG